MWWLFLYYFYILYTGILYSTCIKWEKMSVYGYFGGYFIAVISVTTNARPPSTTTRVPSNYTPEFHWGRQEVHALISKVEEFFEDFYDGTKKKKKIWDLVAEKMREDGYNLTGSECDKKWRNLKVVNNFHCHCIIQ